MAHIVDADALGFDAPDNADVSAAVSLSLEAATCTASPPAVPLYERSAPGL